MKKSFTYLILSFMMVTALSYGQEAKGITYQIVNPEIVNNLNDYEDAFSTADMTKLRFSNKSNTIEFESGLKVALYSANHIISIGRVVNMGKVLTSEPKNKGYYIFGLSSDKKTIIQKFTKTKLK